MNRTIHPADNMHVKGDSDHYFEVGESAIDMIRMALAVTKKTTDDIKTILDLPCGYGRVLRWLQIEFPNADLIASDIDRDGVDFCTKEFGAFPLYSLDPVSAVNTDILFDVIWCGSLLTHMNSHKWFDSISFFLAHLKSGGILIFTTCGRKTFDRIIERNIGLPNEWRTEEVKSICRSIYQKTGFYYRDYPRKTSYGLCFSSCSWVFRFLQQFSYKQTICCEQGWANDQDVYILVK